MKSKILRIRDHGTNNRNKSAENLE